MILQNYKKEILLKKRKKILRRICFFSFFAVAAIMALAYLLFFAGFFSVNRVVFVSGGELEPVLASNVKNWFDVGPGPFNRGNNILFLSSNSLASYLLEKVPRLKSANISKDLFHEIVIETEERQRIGIWCLTTIDKCYDFDREGVVFSESLPSTGFLLMNIFDGRARKDVKLGFKITSPEWVNNMVKTREMLSKNQINIIKFSIASSSLDEFVVSTDKGWRALFSNLTNVDEQTDSLLTFIKEKNSPEELKHVEYFDLRIQDRIYYR